MKNRDVNDSCDKPVTGLYLSQDGIEGSRIFEGFEEFIVLAQPFLPPGFDPELIHVTYGLRFSLLLDVTLADIRKHPQE